ncbi:MAG: phosphoribosylglycinamide formyltransferase [Bosea sp. (in: a-proteobacteria)]
MRTRTAVLISGSGSNMLALAKAAQDPAYPAEISLVLSNQPDAAGLGKAATMGIATAVVDHRAFGPDRHLFDDAVHAMLVRHGIEFVALAGFMRILTPGFVQKWQGRMINIHPSLLPRFKGLDTHARAIEAGDAEHGCTAHWVVPDLDAGEIIAQVSVPVLAGDTEATLGARVLAQEHCLYPKALADAVQRSR